MKDVTLFFYTFIEYVSQIKDHKVCVSNVY